MVLLVFLILISPVVMLVVDELERLGKIKL